MHRVRVGRDVDDFPDLGVPHRRKFCFAAERVVQPRQDLEAIEIVLRVVHDQFEGAAGADHLVEGQLAGDVAGAAGGTAGAVNPLMIGSKGVGLMGVPLAMFVFGNPDVSATTMNCIIVSVPPAVGLAPPGYGVRAEFIDDDSAPHGKSCEVHDDLVALTRRNDQIWASRQHSRDSRRRLRSQMVVLRLFLFALTIFSVRS